MYSKEKLLNIAKNLPDDKKEVFITQSNHLRNLFSSIINLDGPYNIVLDNNVFRRLNELHNGEFNELILTLLTFFDWYKKQTDFSGRILIFPTVFYEYNKKTNFENLEVYWKKFREITCVFEENIGCQLYSDPYITEFNSAKELIKQMQHDEEIITSEIKRISNHTYSQNEIENLLIERGYAPENFKSIILNSLVSLYLNEINTKYLSINLVYHVLAEYIVFNLQNNRDIKKSFNNINKPLRLKKIVTVKNDNLKGIADLELFVTCNLKMQYDLQKHGSNYYPYIPLTFDGALYDLFCEMSVMTHDTIVTTGVDDDNFMSIFERTEVDKQRRIPTAQRNSETFYKSYNAYFNDFDELLK
jgi:hypothetical protein